MNPPCNEVKIYTSSDKCFKNIIIRNQNEIKVVVKGLES